MDIINIVDILNILDILTNNASMLDSSADILDSSASILDSSASMLDSSANILDSSASILDSSASMLDSRIVKLNLIWRFYESERRLETNCTARFIKDAGPLQTRVLKFQTRVLNPSKPGS